MGVGPGAEDAGLHDEEDGEGPKRGLEEDYVVGVSFLLVLLGGHFGCIRDIVPGEISRLHLVVGLKLVALAEMVKLSDGTALQP